MYGQLTKNDFWLELSYLTISAQSFALWVRGGLVKMSQSATVGMRNTAEEYLSMTKLLECPAARLALVLKKHGLEQVDLYRDGARKFRMRDVVARIFLP